MTIKLYYQNPYQTEFSARIIQTGEVNGVPFVILDQTAFYPTGGGQPCDLGEIEGIPVFDVEEIEGIIYHRLAREITDKEKEVNGIIDWARRWDHMQQHTGQHILSAAFRELYQAETVGFHLGKETVTIDISLPEMDEKMVFAIQERANQAVQENTPIHTAFMTWEEAACLPLHKAPGVTENIRIVTIDQFDYNPCGGTHVKQTGEVGLIHILNWERHRGGMRIEFICGLRAIRAFMQKQSILRSLAQQLCSPEQEILAQVERLFQTKKEMEVQHQEWKERWLEIEAASIASQATKHQEVCVVNQIFTQRPVQELQKLSQKVVDINPSIICLFFSHQDSKIQLVFSAGELVTLDMNQLMKEILPLIDGKGGGRRHMANGGGHLKQSPEELAEAVRHLLQLKFVSTPAKQ